LKVADKLTKLANHIGITGGEPLVRSDIFTILEYVAEHARSISMQSNLMLLDLNKAKLLAEIGFSNFFTSLDGASPRTHELLRGINSWKGLMKGIELLKKVGIEFSTVTTINKFNWQEVGKIAKLSEKLGATSACFIPIIPIGRASMSNLMPTPEQMKSAVSTLGKVAKEVGIPIVLWCAPFAVCIDYSDEIYVSTCTDKGIDVDPKGRILLCDTLDIQISDIKKPINEIIKDLNENKYVKWAKNRKPEVCTECPYFSRCGGGCVARSYLIYGTFDAPDPLCPLALHKQSKVASLR